MACYGRAGKAVRLASAAVLVVLAGLLHSPGAHAQELTLLTPRKALGTALYYRWGYVEVEAPKNSADLKTKGLTDTLPDKMPLQGPTIGISFGSFGIVAAYSSFESEINKPADVTGDGVPDIDVLAVQGHSVSMSLVYQPIRHVFIGYGTYRGTISFQIVTPTGGGVGSTVKQPTSGDFYTLALAWGIDPAVRANRTQFFFTVYAAPPATRGSDVVVNTYGIGMGAYF